MTRSALLDAANAASLYARFGPVVYRRCLRLLQNGADAQDATQAVFMRALQHPRRFENGDDAILWLQRIATNYCFNHLRNSKRRQGHLDSLAKEPEHVDEGADANVPLRELCNRVLAHVPEEDRQVAIEVLLHEREHEDVAESLDVSQKTVQRRLHRFLERARSYLGGSSS